MVGLLVLYSASGQDLSKVYDQTVNILLDFSVMWLVANIAPHQLERIAMPLYVLGVVLLVAVELVGSTSHGAQRWLNLGITKIQPSEIMRIAMPMMLAW